MLHVNFTKEQKERLLSALLSVFTYDDYSNFLKDDEAEVLNNLFYNLMYSYEEKKLKEKND